MGLNIANFSVSISDKKILDKVDLVVDDGEIVALMGPNGSGKSSLAYALMGHPFYEVSESKNVKFELNGKSMMDKTADERSREGMYLAFQYPVAISGVNVKDLLLSAIRARGIEIKALDLFKEIERVASILSISQELLKRNVNEGFSGGEKKKMEILQMEILKPKLVILDETDSGLDIDALKIVAKGTYDYVKKNKSGALVITHYQRLLKYLVPDRVVIIKGGVVVDQGGLELVKKIEKKGYSDYE